MFLFLGCNLKSPKHYYNTEDINIEKLSLISYSVDSIILLKIDGVKYRGKNLEKIYLKPGKHKIEAKLNWTNYGAGGIVYGYITSQKTINGCIDIKENLYYKFFGGFPKGVKPIQRNADKWTLRVGIEEISTNKFKSFLGVNPNQWQEVANCL